VLGSLTRLLGKIDEPAELLPLLAEEAASVTGASAAAVVELLEDGTAKVVASHRLPASVRDCRPDVDAVDAELGRQLAACEARFTGSLTLPMMSGGDLFGALVLFFEGDAANIEAVRADAEQVSALGALSLAKAFQIVELRRSHAEVRASRQVLERTQKLRALGEMAAGVSHDLKNILNPLSLHLQVLKRAVGPSASQTVRESIAEMETVVRRGVETTERLREFSRQSPDTRFVEVSIEEVAREAVALARPRLASSRGKRGVRLVQQLEATPPVLAQPAELLGALLNLIVNAIDAVAEAGGTVTVSTACGDDRALVRVVDDGPGIPDDVRARVFEPFFTTKGQAGTGLGLAMVYAFTQRHGGSVSVDSGQGHGTTFTLALPLAHPDSGGG
jgi:signal transduction histidine kinase